MAVSPIHVGVTTRCTSPLWTSSLKPDSPIDTQPYIETWKIETTKTPLFSTLSTDPISVNEHKNTLYNPRTGHIVWDESIECPPLRGSLLKILHRYILSELISYLLISLFFLTFMLLLHKMLQFTDLVVNRGVPLSIVAQFLFTALPVLLLVTLPMSALIASIMVFSRLSSDGESLAMTVSGMNFYSQLIPVGIVGIATAVLSGFLMIFALPWSQNAISEFSQQMLRSRAAAFDIREQIFHDNFDGIMIYVREVDESGKTMKGIVISDTREKGKNQVIFADHGRLIKSPGSSKVWLRLTNGTVHTASESEKPFSQKTSTHNSFSALPKNHYQIARFGSYILHLDLTQAIGKTKALRTSLRSLPLNELRSKLKEQKPGTSRYNAILVELNKKFGVPFTCLILAFLGAPLGAQNRRSGRHGGFALSLSVLVLYYMIVTFAEGMGENGQISASVAVWGPNIFLSLLAGYMIRTVGRRSVIDIWGLLLKPVSPFIRNKS